MTQGIHEQIGLIAPIEAERHFLKVGREMLSADVMPRSANAPLEQRERIFYRVCMNVSDYIGAFAVIDRLVFCSRNPGPLHCVRVGDEIVRENDFDIFADVFFDEACDCLCFHIASMEHAKLTVALANPDNNFLLDSTPAAPSRLRAFPYSADIGFVHLKLTVEHLLIHLNHGRADAMAEIPCCLVASESERALNLARAHALLGLAQQQDCHEPFGERQVAIVEDRASGHRELVVALFAVVERLFRFEFRGVHAASWATDAFRPAQASQHLAALFIGREHGVYIN